MRLLQNFKNVLIALFVFAAWNICVRQFIDQHDLWLPRQHRVHVQFFKEGALVFHSPSGNRLQLFGQLDDARSLMGFDESNHHIFAPIAAADGLAEHVKSFAHARGVAKKDLENARGLFRRCCFQPLLRGFDRLYVSGLGAHRLHDLSRIGMMLRHRPISGDTVRVVRPWLWV